MGNLRDFIVERVPILHGSNYALWKVILEAYFVDLDENVLPSLE